LFYLAVLCETAGCGDSLKNELVFSEPLKMDRLARNQKSSVLPAQLNEIIKSEFFK